MKIADLESKTMTKITAREIYGVKRLRDSAFISPNRNLEEIELPETLIEIGKNVFRGFSSSSIINTDNLNPYCMIGLCNGNSGLRGTEMNTFANEMVLIAKDRILLTNSFSTEENFIIPDTVLNISSAACEATNSRSAFLTSCIIPDTVEIIQDDIFQGQTKLTSITVGSSVRYIGNKLIPETTTTTILIFRQPAGMYIELPAAGESTGLAYYKESRSISIYTDNEYIKNYDWATDNVTATFYSLSEAPT